MSDDIEFSVVSGSNPDMLLACLASLRDTIRETNYQWSVTVICNGADPELASRIRVAHPLARVIENVVARGFAENHNMVLRESGSRYVWLLNDDLLLLPGSIEKVTRFMDAAENARVAVVSPKLLNPDGTLQPSTYGFPTMPQIFVAHSGMRDLRIVNRVLGYLAPVLRPRQGSSRFWSHDKTVEVDSLRGACVAVRMNAVKEVGLMVEVARVGAEETEWHRRFRDAGWKVVYFADASVIHYGSQTVAGGEANHYPEYLKGALYFFQTGRSGLSYRLFCVALLGLFGARAAFKLGTGNRAGVRLASRYARVAWEGLVTGRARPAGTHPGRDPAG